MTDLSPAAQAVLDATDYPEDWATRIRVAAALRALADQVVPEDYEPLTVAFYPEASVAFYPEAFAYADGLRSRHKSIRNEILDIAAELEGGK